MAVTFNNDPTGGQLAGVDTKGNWLYAHDDGSGAGGTSGGGGSTPSTPTKSFGQINTDYQTQLKASGLSESDFLAQNGSTFNGQLVDAISGSTDQTELLSQIANAKSQLSDPTHAQYAQARLDAANAQLNKLQNPAQNEPDIKTSIDSTNQRVTDLYNNLTAFQQTQSQFADDLLLQAKQAAEQPVAGLPEQSGAVIYGGSANQQKVGLSDLMLG